MFKKNYKVIIFRNDINATITCYLHGTKKQIKRDLEYYKSKALWYMERKDFMIMKTIQPV